MTFPTLERVVKGIEYSTLAGLLADFRKQLEHDSGQPVAQIETSAVLFLSDLCNFVGLQPQERDKVLGRAGMTWVESLRTQRITLLKHQNR